MISFRSYGRQFDYGTYLEALRGRVEAEGTLVGVKTLEAEDIPRCGIGDD